jgi:predicted HTH transcriptional regulator
MSILQLIRDRLSDAEDQFTERKEKGVSYEEIAETLVAFANKLPQGHEAILFIGVSNSGEIKGVDSADKMQKYVRQVAESRCYPPIPLARIVVLNEPQGSVVAVVVSASVNKPHFAGPAYVRVGSQNVRASDEMLNQLLDTRNSKASVLLDALSNEEPISLKIVGPNTVVGITIVEAKIRECNSHYVRLYSGQNAWAFPLKRIELSWDENYNRLTVEAYSEYQV